jgi:hypothetical protein
MHRLRQYMMKASFSSNADRASALDLVNDFEGLQMAVDAVIEHCRYLQVVGSADEQVLALSIARMLARPPVPEAP